MAAINMVGDHGTWRVTDRANSDAHGVRWHCVCLKCGHRGVYHGYRLRQGSLCPDCKRASKKPVELSDRERKELDAPLPPPSRLLSDDDESGSGRCSFCNRQSVFYSGRCHWCGRSGTRDVSQHVRAG